METQTKPTNINQQRYLVPCIKELFVDADAGPVFFETRFDFFCVKGPLKTENKSEMHNSF